MQWTMGAAPRHPILGGVLKLIQGYFAAGFHLNRTSIIKSTGPGIWSDAITQHIERSYGVRFGVGEEHASDDKGPFSHRRMHRKGAHIGDVLLLPTRAFAMGSGGTGMEGGDDSADQLVRHNFKGTWKKGYVDMDGGSSGGGSSSAWSPPQPRVSAAGELEAAGSEVAIEGAACAAGNATVLAAAVLPAGCNSSAVPVLTVHAAAREPLRVNWLWWFGSDGAQGAGLPAPQVSPLLLCGGHGGTGHKAGVGLVHDNPGGRFKHKTVRYPAPALATAEDASPVVFVTALSSPPEGAGEDKAVFATTVRSSAPTKFEVNVVRLDSESGWRQELAVAYLALPRPAGGPGTGGSASLRLRDGAEAQYGVLQVGAKRGMVERWVRFGSAFAAGAAPAVLLTVQATEGEHRDEVFSVTLGPNATTVEGFSVRIRRTDESTQTDWSQRLELNWLAFPRRG